MVDARRCLAMLPVLPSAMRVEYPGAIHHVSLSTTPLLTPKF